MNCNEFELILSEYLEGERPEAGAHLSSCPSCRALVAEVRAVVELCRAYPERDPSEKLVASILEATTGRRRPRWWPSPALALRFASGLVLSLAFASLLSTLPGIRVAAQAASTLRPEQVVRKADRFGREIYSELFRLYARQREIRAELALIKIDIWRAIEHQIGRITGESTLEEDESDEPVKERSSALEA